MQTMTALAKIRSIFLVLAMLLAPLVAVAQAPSPTFDLAEYQGKVVVVDFWASWCVPCRRSFPWLNDMHAKYAEQGLVVIGVNVDANQKDAAAFLEDYPAAFNIHYDTEAIMAKEFGVEAMPSSFVIGRDGQIRARHLGFKVKRQDEYEAILVDALGEKP
jgi:cytochrome c biogenesis protein CcmG/thiol:disulfide interchange protein DsbE